MELAAIYGEVLTDREATAMVEAEGLMPAAGARALFRFAGMAPLLFMSGDFFAAARVSGDKLIERYEARYPGPIVRGAEPASACWPAR